MALFTPLALASNTDTMLRNDNKYREAPGGSSGGFWVDCEPAVELAPVSER